MGLSINDSVYSCVFFFLTGLHFFHLVVGLFLLSLLSWSCSFYFLSYFTFLFSSFSLVPCLCIFHIIKEIRSATLRYYFYILILYFPIFTKDIFILFFFGFIFSYFLLLFNDLFLE